MNYKKIFDVFEKIFFTKSLCRLYEISYEVIFCSLMKCI